MPNYAALIPWEQKLLLIAAYSYNTEENPMMSDAVYDYTTRQLQQLKAQYPSEWASNSIYPDIFLDPDEAWKYTSQHFPINEEIHEWMVLRKKQVEVWKARQK